jgi:hypothetical protein
VFASLTTLDHILPTIQLFLRQNHDIEPTAELWFFMGADQPRVLHFVDLSVCAYKPIKAWYFLIPPPCRYHFDYTLTFELRGWL